MPDVPAASPTTALAQELLDLTARLGARAEEDPFGNPVLLVSLAITRRMDTGSLTEADIAALIRHLRDAAFADRAKRIAAYVGGVDTAANDGDPARAWRSTCCVPTRTTARCAGRNTGPWWSGPVSPRCSPRIPRSRCPCRSTTRWPRRPAAGRHPTFASHRPPPITLRRSSTKSVAAIANGRDAIDRFNAALISRRARRLAGSLDRADARPVILSTWVGYDTDGRTDIGWWDTLRLRLEMKRLQLARLHAQVSVLPSAGALAERVAEALDAVDRADRSLPGPAGAGQGRGLRPDAGRAAAKPR